ncbi:MAG: 50S ribosomal protein L9 [Actinomycetota bacterium]|nr:50S ribosomal protein L9 [Actinomycetota bacterium]
MRVLLQKPVDKLGQPGDVVEVADGYARNYLVPQGMAIKAAKGAERQAESMKRAHDVRQSKEKTEHEAVASKLIAAGGLTIQARAGEEGKLFGSVTSADVADAIVAQTGVTVDRKAVHLEEPIRTVGTHEVRVKLFTDVEPVVTVEVVAQD